MSRSSKSSVLLSWNWIIWFHQRAKEFDFTSFFLPGLFFNFLVHWYALFEFYEFIVSSLPLLFLLNSIGFPILEANSPITRSLMGSWKIWGLFDRRPKRGDEGIIFGAFFEALLEKRKEKKYKNIQTRLIFFLENVDDDGLANSQPTKFHHYWIFFGPSALIKDSARCKRK